MTSEDNSFWWWVLAIILALFFFARDYFNDWFKWLLDLVLSFAQEIFNFIAGVF